MGKHGDKPKDPRDLRRQAREVADSLAIAFILAMVIRHYVLEVFKIPTKSMEPTLLGDPWSGDKILVNKFAYDLRGPRRWEVAVFKYPQKTSLNYIKRVVGLPGETICVEHGDVYINARIARKPWRVQRDLWRMTPHSPKSEAWNFIGPDGARKEPASLEFTADSTGGTGEAELRYDRAILAYETDKFGGLFTSDVMVEFSLIPREAAGSLSVEITHTPPLRGDKVLDVWEARFPLSDPDCVPEVWRGPPGAATIFAREGKCRLPKDKAARIQVCNVDQSTIVRVNGSEVVAKDYDLGNPVFEDAAYTRQAHVRLRWSQAHATVRDPAIYADVHYTSNDKDARGDDVAFSDYKRKGLPAYAVREAYQLKDDEYFVLGDNSANSNDSRAWQTVPRSYLVGEAFMVLWPLGRMKPVR